jgi:Tfp pilus assembly protein PilO
MNALAKLGTLGMGRVIMISLVICGLYYLVAYDSGDTWRASISQSVQTKDEISKTIARLDGELQEIETLKRAQEQDAEKLKLLLGYIPEKLSNFELMRTLSNEAKAVGVSINQIRDKGGTQAKENEFYEEIGVDIDLEGTFPQLVLFLSNLTKLNLILTLETLDLKTTGAGGEGALEMAAQVNGYRYVAKKDGAPK